MLPAEAFRLIGSEGVPLLDLLIRVGEARPQPGKRLLCRHPFDEKRRVYVTPTAVIPLLRLVWKGWAAALEEKLATDAGIKALASGASSAAPSPTPAASADSSSRNGNGSGAGMGLTQHMAAVAAPHVPPPQSGLVPIGQEVEVDGPSSDGGSSSAATADGPAPPAAAASGAHRSRSGSHAGGPLPGLTEVASVFPEGVSMRARFPSLEELRSFVKSQLNLIREDHLRPLNPTPYKVSVSR